MPRKSDLLRIVLLASMWGWLILTQARTNAELKREATTGCVQRESIAADVTGALEDHRRIEAKLDDAIRELRSIRRNVAGDVFPEKDGE